MKLTTISPSVTNGNRSVGMLSLIGITRGGALQLPGSRAPEAPTALLLRLSDRRADRDDPPRLRGVPVEREDPVLAEARRARSAPGHDPGRVAVLEVAPPFDVHLDRPRGRLGSRIEVRHPDLLDPRSPHHETGLAARVSGVQQLARGFGVCDPLQTRIATV